MESGSENDAQNNTCIYWVGGMYALLRIFSTFFSVQNAFDFFSAYFFSFMQWNAVFNFTSVVCLLKTMEILCVAAIFVMFFSLCYMRVLSLVEFGQISWYLLSVSNSHEHHGEACFG